jgi:protein SCO1
MKFVSIAVLVALVGCSKPAPLPVLGQVPGFTLTSDSGQPFDRKSLDGKVWVADFIYTTCPGPCPRMSSLMSQVQKASLMIPGVQLVSFTVDPEHDTPAILAQYAARYKADPTLWHFLTGSREALDHLARDAFKLSNVDGSLNHSTRLVLLDRQSRIRGYYGTTDDDPVVALVRDMKRVLAEGS